MTDLSAYIPEMVETRRRFHRYPEIAWTEFLTTQTIIERVRALGFETVVGKALFDIKHAFGRNEEMIQEAFQEALGQGLDPKIGEEIGGFTGCLAIWKTPRPGPVTALRFDIDCVNVEEDHTDNNEAFREGFDSSRCGLMHACGHDGHAAIGLAVARWIKDNADQLCGTIKLIFQPAEEGTKGAAGIAYSDNLDDVDVILGAHLGVAAKLHEVAIVRSGFLNTTKMNATFKGTPAHSGSCAEKGRNALMAACTASLQLMGIARHGGGNSNVNVGTIHAGEGRNVVPLTGDLNLKFVEKLKRLTAICKKRLSVWCEELQKVTVFNPKPRLSVWPWTSIAMTICAKCYAKFARQFLAYSESLSTFKKPVAKTTHCWLKKYSLTVARAYFSSAVATIPVTTELISLSKTKKACPNAWKFLSR